jgi:hypothetical protein
MGVDTRRPPLPAPTESSTLQTSRDDVTGTDLATDLSRRTDHTSYSIPEDGSPITLTTSKRKDHKQKDREHTLTRTTHQSQTSLLIEYFEGGKGPNVHSRPSVRVKVTPSSARKSKDTKDHIQITEAGGHRKPSYTRRISLGPKGTGEIRAGDSDVSSYTSAAEDSSLAGRRPPVEIEVMHRDRGSDLSGTNALGENQYIPINPSDISSMPPDSMLDGYTAASPPRRKGSRSLARDEVIGTGDTLKAPSRRRSRSLSRERIAAQKVIEKLGNKSRHASGEKHKHKSRSRSVSKELLVENVQSPRRRSSRHQPVEELPSGAESSLVTNSQASTKRKSGDQYSFRSGTSKSSINNPRLLETVEDAIRRLILPELTALKHEQKTQQNRSKFERDRRESIASGSSVSREELTRRGSKHASAPDLTGRPKVVLNRDEQHPGTYLSGNSIKGRKDRQNERDYESSERSFDRGMSEETVIRDGEKVSRKRSKDGHRLRDTAAAALVGGILTHAALKHHDSRSSVDRRERRKKRGKSHSRSESLAESTEEIFHKYDVPPMPMRSEITESDLTRDSLLSERTSTPTSERRRAEIRHVTRGSPHEITSPGSRTPTRSPRVKGLGTYHSNTPRGDITTRATHGEVSPTEEKYHTSTGEAALAGATAAAGTLAAAHLLNHHDGNVDAYEHGRGLSPIQSVASYRDESEPPNRESFIRRSHSTGSISSDEDMAKNRLSIKTISSVPSTEFARSKRHKGISLETGKEILEPHDHSEHNDDEDGVGDRSMEAWYDQQHAENDRYRDSLGDDSFRDSTVDIRHLTNYTDDSMDAPYLDKVTAAQHIRGVGANPEYIRTPLAVESAVASLHDASVVDVRSTQSGVSRLEERSYLDSPNDDDHDYVEAGRQELFNLRHGSPLRGEYKVEDNDVEPSTKKPYEQYAANSPRRNIARSLEEREEPVSMTASSVPIADDPIPEIGHGLEDKSDISTNPSIIQGPLGGVTHDNRTHWPFQPTPPQSKGDLLLRSNNSSAHESLKAAAANMLSAAAGAGALAALARERKAKENPGQDITRDLQEKPLAVQETYQQEVEHEYGTQDPYVNNQPIPTPLLAKDEGYISAANPRSAGALTPDYRRKGVGVVEDDDGMGSIDDGDDPFVGQTHMRHLSGNSHGMPSPLYDSATGRGVDRIQSKDVVALMDHVSLCPTYAFWPRINGLQAYRARCST